MSLQKCQDCRFCKMDGTCRLFTVESRYDFRFGNYNGKNIPVNEVRDSCEACGFSGRFFKKRITILEGLKTFLSKRSNKDTNLYWKDRYSFLELKSTDGKLIDLTAYIIKGKNVYALIKGDFTVLNKKFTTVEEAVRTLNGMFETLKKDGQILIGEKEDE